MSVQNWPLDLPQRVTYGIDLSIDAVANKQATQFESGPNRRRNRFSNVPSIQNVSMFFKNAEIESFISFYKNTLSNGTKYFWFDLPVGSLMMPHIVRIENDNINTVGVSFDRWTFQAQLLVRNRFVYDPGAAWLIQTYGTDFVENVFADPIQEAVNVTYPGITENP